MAASSVFQSLRFLRESAGPARTVGLSDDAVTRFAGSDPRLPRAIELAAESRRSIEPSLDCAFRLAEPLLCQFLQSRILNFYPAASTNPYVPLAALGPWIVTTHGAVVYDAGGYGMLGLGHAPAAVSAAMGQPAVMANVMTPSFSQQRLTERLVGEIGRQRGGCPFGKFVFLNSGSEAITFACRLADARARTMTDAGARHAGKRSVRMAVADGFHGRTEGPARLSHSCRIAYAKHLASFRNQSDTVFLPVNDLQALRQAFHDAERDGTFVEALFVEPVMGEGVAGLALSAEFYDEARALTHSMGSLLVVDSIQAALRAHGCLSIVDYPGFEDAAPPDIETYSKALNAGQFPLSVVALTDAAAAEYVTGLYGNTMTGNPRAMEVGCAVLDSISDALRTNIQERGQEFRLKLEQLALEFPGSIERVVGTGLMVSAVLNPARHRVLGDRGLEQFLRIHGIEMIHAGDCGLRFTPCFDITSDEIDLIVSVVREGLREQIAT